jgi:hypothetical protein
MASLLRLQYRGQSQAVYAWSNELFLNPVAVSLGESQQLVDRVWANSRPGNPPVVKDGRGSSSARASRRTIHLPKGTRLKYLLLHELAHSLSIDDTGYHFIDEGFDGHGPNFARLLLDLWVKYANQNETACLALAKTYGVQISPQNHFLDKIAKPG